MERDLAGTKRAATLRVGGQTRAQTAPADLHYLFAPLKAARLDYMVQKAVEMGVSRLQPVLTRHGQVGARQDRAHARPMPSKPPSNAAFLTLPRHRPAGARLPGWLAEREPARWLVFCDEDAELADPVAALGQVPPRSPLAVLIGPEGGFAEDERAALLQTAEPGAARARPAHFARRYRGGGGAGFGSGRARRLAVR